MSASAAESENHQRETASADHRIVVFSVDDDPEKLTQVLIASSEFDRVAARRIVRALPGIIPGNLTRTAAATLADDIRKLGLHATAVAATEVPDLSHPMQTHHLCAGDSSLEVMDGMTEHRSWPWGAVAVISIGVVPSSAPARHRSAPALAQSSSHKLWNEGVTIDAKRHPEALVVFAADRAVVAFASDEMNYEYLGSRMTGASSANFRQLVKDLVAHAPDAWVTPSTRAFLDRSPTRHFEFRSRDDFRRYTEFQTLLSELP
ncbi:MAG: hypothetical protein R3C59_27690 [Planctomycetaceae bacterium]